MGRAINKKYKVEHVDFSLVRDAYNNGKRDINDLPIMVNFNDCVRYSKAKVINFDFENSYAEIQIESTNPSMGQAFLSLISDRWRSYGFNLTVQS